MKRFYSINAERRLRLFFAVVILPAGAVCAFMHLRDGMIFVLFAPFFPIFFYPECLAWAATQLFLCKKEGACNAICDYGLAHFPASQGLLTAKSYVLFRARRFEEAESEMTKALRLNPISVQTLIDRSAARCYLSRFEEAEMDANQAIGLAPGWHDAYLNRACARLGQQNYEGCLEDTKLLQRFGKHLPAVRMLAVSCYLMTGRLVEAEALISDLNGKVKSGSFDALSLANVHFARNEYAEVLEICAQVTDQEPSAYEFIAMQARAYIMLSEGALVMDSTARAIALQPDTEDCHVLRVFVLADAGRLDEADTECQKIREGCASASMTRDAQAVIFWRREQWDKMLEASGLAIDRCATSANSHAMRSLALTGLERFEEAIAAGKKATSLQPLQAFGWYSLANAYLKSGLVSEALDCLNTALTNDPHNRYCYQLRAQVHLQVGDKIQGARDQVKYDELQAKFVANWQPPLA
jgi:tetratricopeptide (TPR) repeat protein